MTDSKILVEQWPSALLILAAIALFWYCASKAASFGFRHAASAWSSLCGNESLVNALPYFLLATGTFSFAFNVADLHVESNRRPKLVGMEASQLKEIMYFDQTKISAAIKYAEERDAKNAELIKISLMSSKTEEEPTKEAKYLQKQFNYGLIGLSVFQVFTGAIMLLYRYS